MSYPLRYLFHSHAAAFGGHIVRPKNLVLEAGGASALVVTGGRCVSKLGPTSIDEYFEVKSASTFAEGLYKDRAKFVEVTRHKREEQTLTAVSTARAEVNGLSIGRKPRLTIGRIRAQLTNTSAGVSGQNAIQVSSDTLIDGVSIDGYKLIIQLETGIFRRLDTHAKLLASIEDPGFLVKSGEQICMSKRLLATASNKRARQDVLRTPPFRRLIRNGDTIYTTIVKSIRWDGRRFPKSEIHGNLVILPTFGRVYFGELLVSPNSRRLTMARMAMGSDAGGSSSAGDVQSNGSWSP
jgi:hypothetical protein